MKTRAKTIQIFLPDGNPRGVRIAEMTNNTVKAVLFPRNQFDFILTRDELKNVGFYFLIGEDEEGKAKIYIGEAEDCADRLKHHQRKKDFWNYAIVVISATKIFTKTHVKFLEHIAIQEAKEANRYEIENSVDPNLPHISESMEADMLNCFDVAKILISTLGYPIFDSVSRAITVTNPVSDIFRLNGIGIKAEGNLIDDGFVVYKGSEAKLSTVASCHDNILALREKLINTGILKKENETYHLAEDYVFNSPSAASSTLLGRPSNGWRKWKNAQGKTLDEVKRQNII